MESKERLDQLTTEQTEFKREIGVFGGVSIIGGIMIGSGIFYLGSYVLERTGMDSGMSLLCWVSNSRVPPLMAWIQPGSI